ncbi:MAG TPA: FHA domain-containing protein [Ktedonobacteraceae bacterium]
MDARFYNSEEIDIEKVATDLENMFRAQGYQTQQLGDKDQIAVQLKKGGELAALVGLQTALTLTIQRTNGGVVAMIGQQKWVDKAAVGAVGLVAAPFIPVLWPLLVTAGAGAIKQAALGNQVLNTVDGLVLQQAPGVRPGPLPGSIAPQFQQYWAPPPQQYVQSTPVYVPPTPVYVAPTPPPAPMYTPPAPVYTPPAAARPRCPSCNTPYEPGDTFCSGCGRGLTPPKQQCPGCKTELKPGVAFCPKCGANTFQATSSQPARVAPAPARPETPVYTPPKPATPAYTPPQPATPVYTPTTPVYKPPVKPAEPEPYVPPVPQEPPVVPHPTVTIVPGSSRPATPPPAPKAPPVPVYIPTVPAQPPTVAAQPQAPAQPPTPVQQPSQTIKARPTSQQLGDPGKPWGTLSFTNGREVTLAGERVLVGRSDHDLGGVQPEVDLAAFEHADTVSRGHATIEHIGSAYQLTDLNSTNFSRVNGKRLEPSVPTPINDGDTLQFGKIQCTFKKS